MLVESLASLQKDFLETSRSNRKYKSTCIHEHLRTTSKIIIINWRAYYSAVSHGLPVFINKTKIVQKQRCFKLHLNSNCSSFNDLDHVVNLKAKFERLKFELTFLCSERHVHHENDRGSKSDRTW